VEAQQTLTAAVDDGWRRRPGPTGRRIGYAAGAVVSLLILGAINVWPGWQAVPFLTPDTVLVLPYINAAFVLAVIVDAILLIRDPPWLKALCYLVSGVVALAATIAVWQVFPFEWERFFFDATLLFRVLLAIGILGGMIGVVVQAVDFVRALLGYRPRPGV
jgi:hypothetical protein